LNKQIFVLALDGVPYSLLNKLFDDGIMPNFKSLVNGKNFKPMNSVLPAISSVAWTSFMTGKNPSAHNIYGFIERIPETMEVYIPTSVDIKSQTIWEYLSKKDKRVFTMNVPVTYPPKMINGIMVCGFLGTDILKATYPKEVGSQLKDDGYIIDVDTVAAREDLHGFMRELEAAFEKRRQSIIKFYAQEKWDFFMAHIMETDRLHHFLWEHYENNNPYWTDQFLGLYRKIDDLIGELLKLIPQKSEFLILSDHGFTTLKKEVYVNKWLFDNGYLSFNSLNPPESLHDIHPKSQAYSLIPGRIYINLHGREKNGSVLPGIAYESLREELKTRLIQLTDPDTGKRVIKNVLTREQVYRPDKKIDVLDIKNENIKADDPFYLAPDLIIDNHDGYDFKGNLWMDQLMKKGPVVGTHTFDNAFLYIKDKSLKNEMFSIVDMMPTILDLLELEYPIDLHGKTVLN